MCCRTRFTQHLSLIRFFSHFQWQQQQIRHSFHIFALDQTLPVLLHFTSCSILILDFCYIFLQQNGILKMVSGSAGRISDPRLASFNFPIFFFYLFICGEGFQSTSSACLDRASLCNFLTCFFWCVFGVALKFIQNQISSCSV